MPFLGSAKERIPYFDNLCNQKFAKRAQNRLTKRIGQYYTERAKRRALPANGWPPYLVLRSNRGLVGLAVTSFYWLVKTGRKCRS